MSDSDALSSALALRLNLQLAMSALPLVGEELDAPLARWIDSAPLPGRGRDGGDVEHEVRVASDLSAAVFALHGPAAAVAPRIEAYLAAAAPGAPPGLREVLEELTPARAGSFVAIDGGGMTTGWLLPVRLPLDAVLRRAPGLAPGLQSPARPAVECVGLWQTVGAAAWTEAVLAASGHPVTAVAAAGRFAALAGAPLPPAVRAAALAGAPPRIALRLGRVPRVGLILPGRDLGTLRALAAATGVDVAPGLAELIDTLGAADLAAVEYAVRDGAPELVAHIAPAAAVSCAGEIN